MLLLLCFLFRCFVCDLVIRGVPGFHWLSFVFPPLCLADLISSHPPPPPPGTTVVSPLTFLFSWVQCSALLGRRPPPPHLHGEGNPAARQPHPGGLRGSCLQDPRHPRERCHHPRAHQHRWRIAQEGGKDAQGRPGGGGQGQAGRGIAARRGGGGGGGGSRAGTATSSTGCSCSVM